MRQMSILERRLVEEYAYLVPEMIGRLTKGFYYLPDDEWDELTQTGFLALCRAAVRYDRKRPFKAYATASIRNAIYDHWRADRSYREHICFPENVPADGGTGWEDRAEATTRQKRVDEQALDRMASDYLKRIGENSSATIKKGISSLLLQSHCGYTSSDLAGFYHVPSNRIRAWQSKAKKQLKKDQTLYELLA